MPPGTLNDLRIEAMPLDGLVPYAANARLHPNEQVEQLAASIAEFGFNVPVLVDQAGVLIAGHGRVLAAKRLGLGSVPTIRLGHLTLRQAKAYRLADNKIALNSTWDTSLLKAEFAELTADGFDLGLTGFSGDEVLELLATSTEGETDPDEIPAVPTIITSRAGDVWILGRHRIICGDSTDAASVGKLLAGARPHLMVTDPPYGVEYDPAWRNAALQGSNTARTGVVLNDDRADWREAWALFPGDVAYVWHGALHAATVADSLTACGFDIRAQIIWAKERLVMGRGHYHWQHEPCWYGVRKGGTGHWSGDRKQATLWTISSRDQDATTIHGTQKPVECMRRPIENNSSPGQSVYEPFSGSGTTIIAAEASGRACFASELSPAYVDVAVARWQNFTGDVARLEGDGRAFDAINQERSA
jgi:DNA modification methylase